MIIWLLAHVKMLCIELVAERRIVHFGVFLPHCYSDHGNPNEANQQQFWKIEYHEASIILAQAMINTQPE